MSDTDAVSFGLRITCLILIIFFSWPICIYGLHVLRLNWNNVYFVKRRRSITLAIAIQSALALFISSPMTTITCMAYGTYGAAVRANPNLVFLPLFLSKYASVCNTCLIFARIWLYYFDVTYTKQLANKEWKTLLNDQAATNDWFAANKNTWGSERRWLLVCALITVCYMIMYIMMSYDENPVTNLIAGAFFVFATVLAVVIRSKFPRFRDELGIRREVTILTVVWCTVNLLVYTFIIVFGFALLYNDSQWDMFWACMMYVVTGYLTFMMFMTTGYVYRFYVRKQTQSELRLNLISSVGSRSEAEKVKDINVKSWKPIIAKMDGYELFMDHLVKEFSIENLLFLTEFAQFKAILVELFPAKMKSQNFEEALAWTLELPSKLPLSVIASEYRQKVEATSSEEAVASRTSRSIEETSFRSSQFTEFMTACSRMYEKYIRAYNAPLEVNISSLKRNSLAQIFGNVNSLEEMMGDGTDTAKKEEMFKTALLRFQSAVLDIEALMNDSFTRFKGTKVAKEYWMHNVTENEQ